MSNKSFIEYERRKIENLRKNQLPHRYKKMGLVITLFLFALLFINRFTFDSNVLRLISKYGMLVGLLIISISKEQVEDELVTKLRMQSYGFAFIAGIVLSIIQPFVTYGIEFLIEGKAADWQEMGDFQILWILLIVQVLYFEVLKRAYR